MLRFIMGLVCGVAVGLIVAPAPGEVTRQRIQDEASRWKEQQIEKGRETARDAGSTVAERLYDRAIGE